MLNHKNFSLITGLVITVILITLARKSKIHSVHFIWWAAITGSILLFAFFPALIDVIGRLFGIAYPPILISVAGIGLVLIKILSMDMYITQNELRYKKLAQKMALLEKKINDQSSEKKSEASTNNRI
ncbi:MAG: DUF2304 domain-containing protein [Thermodesulfobacteriota bacterium]|nr:DUF2304 domain-containing protein [Thermodesulfobacteriota bacterium]